MEIIIEWLYDIFVEAGMRTTALIYENQQFHRRRRFWSVTYGTVWVLLTGALLFGTTWLMRYLSESMVVWLCVGLGLGLTYWTGKHALSWLQTYLWVMRYRDVPERITSSGQRMKHANHKKR